MSLLRCLPPLLAGRFPHLSFHLSHLFLPVIHGLAVLKAARRRSLSKAAQAQTPTFFLLLVQNFILKERTDSVLTTVALPNETCYSGSSYQPPSSDDERIFACPAEERLCRFALAHTDCRRLGSPVSLTNPQFLTGNRRQQKVLQVQRWALCLRDLLRGGSLAEVELDYRWGFCEMLQH